MGERGGIFNSTLPRGANLARMETARFPRVEGW